MASQEQMRLPRAVGVLAGMGPAAGAEFLRLFVRACEDWLRSHGREVVDQAFPEHWVAQLPVPDRTGALLDPAVPQPLEMMSRGVHRLADLGVRHIAISCNTAHAWHQALQACEPRAEILHIARETAADLKRRGFAKVALLATEGTYRTRLYDEAFGALGMACAAPAPAARQRLMQGIYQGVKAGNQALAEACFTEVCREMAEVHPGAAFVMACTEIPLALPLAPEAARWTLVDPAQVLAAALARRAFEGDAQ